MARAKYEDHTDETPEGTQASNEDLSSGISNEDEDTNQTVTASTKCNSSDASKDIIVQCESDREETVAANNNTRDKHESVEDVENVIDKQTAPDGGWGWCIVIGCILLRCVVGGIVRSRGIMFVKFQDRFNGSATSTALITSVTGFVRLAVGPAVSILTNRFTCRRLTVIGAVIFTIGLVITGYAPNQTFMYFSFGVLGGLGRGFVLTPVPILLGYYFDKRRSLAFGIASSGFSIGGFALSPVIELLFQNYGFQGAFLFLGGIAMHIFIAASLFRPIELQRKFISNTGVTKEFSEQVVLQSMENLETEDCLGSSMLSVRQENSKTESSRQQQAAEDNSEQAKALLEQSTEPTDNITVNSSQKSKPSENDKGKSKKNKWIDLSILKDVRYVCYVLATICFTLPNAGLFLPSLAVARGVTEIQAASLLSVTAGFDTVFRIISGFVLDLKVFRNVRPEIFNLLTFFQCLIIVLFPSMKTYGDFFALCAFHGALMGTRNAQGSVIVMDMLGVDKLASSMAVTMTVHSLAVFLGPAVSGWLIDIYGTYDGPYYFGSVAIFVGAVIMAFGQIRKRYKDSKRAKAEKDAKTVNETE